MLEPEIFSKQWCDLLFAHRNREYGAYALRSRAGRRYRFAMLSLVSMLLVLTLSLGGLYAYARYQQYLALKEAGKALAAMQRQQRKEGYELKFMSTARLVPSHRLTPGATESVPEIVEGNPLARVFGADGPVAYDPDEELVVSPLQDTLRADQGDKPLVKQKVVPTEVVRSMPEFPGGHKAFMQWLDEHIPYPADLRKAGKEGRVMLTFIVTEQGYVADIEVRDAFSPKIERTLKAALRGCPRWQPGLDDHGQPAPVRISVPIDYRAR